MYTLISIGRVTGVSSAQSPKGTAVVLHAVAMAFAGTAVSVIAPNGEYVYSCAPFPNLDAIQQRPYLLRVAA